jgi:hypothetical protein
MPIENNTTNHDPVIEEAKITLAKMLEDLAPYLPKPDRHQEPRSGQWGDASGLRKNIDPEARRQRYFAAIIQ